MRADELHHLATAGRGPAWFETFALEFAAADASLAGYLAVTLRPSEARAWFWACVTGVGRSLVAVVEPDAPLPRRTPLELRASGLWLDVECETPFDHVSVGLEAFGLAFDDPDDAIGSGRGSRVPVGFDLEWETSAAVAWRGSDAYSMACRVTGEILIGEERHEIDATGARSHCWGDDAWWRRSAGGAVVPPADVAAVAAFAIPDAGGDSVLRSVVRLGSGAAHWVHDIVPRRAGP
jgi:hypothetical protein